VEELFEGVGFRSGEGKGGRGGRGSGEHDAESLGDVHDLFNRVSLVALCEIRTQKTLT
jgi:hypothetical protein